MLFRGVGRLLPLFVLLFALGCEKEKPSKFETVQNPQESVSPIVKRAGIDYVKAELEKFAPVELSADLKSLPSNEIEVLKKIVRAAEYMDKAFLRQVYSKNEELHPALSESNNPDDKVYLELFDIMAGPFNRLDEDKPFLNTEPKPLGATFYPKNMTREEFQNWVKAHPEDKNEFESNFTVIKKDGVALMAVPYSVEYKDLLEPTATLLREAADLTSDPTLKKYLVSRADALLSNDYFQSDMDWMDITGPIDPVIGPYEVYEDKLLGCKAAFEAFVTVVDPVESEKLAKVGTRLFDLERNLPIPTQYKNFERGKTSPIKVASEVFSAGDTKAGVQTTAFNLPNDERVREAKGSKKVLLKNVAKAKFEKCWIPIANEVLQKKDLAKVSFDAYFNHTLLHEMSHGLGPGNIVMPNGVRTTVNKALAELYSTIEECKADVLGIYSTPYLIGKKVVPANLVPYLYPTYLGGMFRAVRFGIGEAHGGGVAIQFNWMMEKGAFKVDNEGRFTVDPRKCEKEIRDLAATLLLIEAKGDYQGARKLIEKYRVMTPVLEKALKKLEHIPVDIRPIYTFEKQL